MHKSSLLHAQERELTAHPLERPQVVSAEIGDGLKLRGEPAEQSHDLDIAGSFSFEQARGAHAVLIPIDVELQQVGRVVSGPAGRGWSRAGEAGARQVEADDESLDEAGWIILSDVVVEGWCEE